MAYRSIRQTWASEMPKGFQHCIPLSNLVPQRAWVRCSTAIARAPVAIASATRAASRYEVARAVVRNDDKNELVTAAAAAPF
jgi:hypothetical protein